MTSPQDQLSSLAQQADQARTDRYWERSAPVTFVVLLACVAASALVQPMNWKLALGFVAAGAVFAGGGALYKNGRPNLGGLLMVASLVLAVYVAHTAGMRGAALYVQGLGLYFVGNTGALVFSAAVRAESPEQ